MTEDELQPAETTPAIPEHLELLQYSADMVALVDPQGTLSFVNSLMMRDAGYSPDDVVGHFAVEFVHPDDQERVASTLSTLVNDALSSCPLTFRLRTRSGDVRWLEGRAVNLLTQPSVRSVLVALHDVTHRVEAETVLAHRATHDALTDLPNRALMLDRLTHLLEHARRHDQLVAVYFWDVDHFKFVNDRAGHAVGDSLLIEVAHRAEAVMRGEDTVARLGGDEFVACAALASQAQICALADRLLESLVVDVVFPGGKHVPVTASIGVAFGRAVAADHLLSAADAAMYKAKRSGGRAITIVNVGPASQAEALAATQTG